jgi:hypothetical protein
MASVSRISLPIWPKLDSAPGTYVATFGAVSGLPAATTAVASCPAPFRL